MAKDRETVAVIRSGLSDFASPPSDEKVIFQEHLAAMTNQWVLGKVLHTQSVLPTAFLDGATKVLAESYSTPGGLSMLEQVADSIPYARELLEAARTSNDPSWTAKFPWWSTDRARA